MKLITPRGNSTLLHDNTILRNYSLLPLSRLKEQLVLRNAYWRHRALKKPMKGGVMDEARKTLLKGAALSGQAEGTNSTSRKKVSVEG